MTHMIKIVGTEVKFPQECAVCSRSTEKTYRIEHTFSFGRGTVPISLAIPLCPEHLAVAKSKSPAERLCERLGLFGGIAAGLLVSWLASGQGLLLVTVLSGLGVFLIVWTATRFWLAPVFASPETKAARNSVHLKKYWPASNELELELSNERLASQLIQLNK
jgi:hypothetical protein